VLDNDKRTLLEDKRMIRTLWSMVLKTAETCRSQRHNVSILCRDDVLIHSAVNISRPARKNNTRWKSRSCQLESVAHEVTGQLYRVLLQRSRSNSLPGKTFKFNNSIRCVGLSHTHVAFKQQCCKGPQGERSRLKSAVSICFQHCEGPPPTILLHFEGEETLLEAFKMNGFKQQKTASPYIFMKKFSKS